MNYRELYDERSEGKPQIKRISKFQVLLSGIVVVRCCKLHSDNLAIYLTAIAKNQERMSS